MFKSPLYGPWRNVHQPQRGGLFNLFVSIENYNYYNIITTKSNKHQGVAAWIYMA
ncbi:hypothetical protein SAMN05421868_1133 [Paenibacillus naphthalenovorans]|nr:hypothetical protein SAMN05421868_1133 [Paenibacillus naphthalenovorans]